MMMRICLLLATSAGAFRVPGGPTVRPIRVSDPAAGARRWCAVGSAAPRCVGAVVRRVESGGGGGGEKRLPWFVDPGTYGGVIVLTVALLAVPYGAYSALVARGADPNSVGVLLSGVFVVGSILLWTFSYVFRVFTKKMTYGTQLKQYEDAVIQKRFEELADEEVEALLGELDREA